MTSTQNKNFRKNIWKIFVPVLIKIDFKKYNNTPSPFPTRTKIHYLFLPKIQKAFQNSQIPHPTKNRPIIKKITHDFRGR